MEREREREREREICMCICISIYIHMHLSYWKDVQVIIKYKHHPVEHTRKLYISACNIPYMPERFIHSLAVNIGICLFCMTQTRKTIRVTHCHTLQHTASSCNTLQHIPERRSEQHTATHCNTLQHAATRCNTLQHIPERRSEPRFTVERSSACMM